MPKDAFNYAQNGCLILQRRIKPNLSTAFQQFPLQYPVYNEIIIGFLTEVDNYLCERLAQPSYMENPGL